MVVTNDDALAERIRLLRGQGMDPQRRYWHPVIGYNYRMMNLAAAIGLAQLEKIDEQIAARLQINAAYRERLLAVPGISPQAEKPWARHVYWMFSVVFDSEFWQERDRMIEILSEQGVETRPLFYPAHTFPPYLKFAGGERFPVAENLSARGISLPTWTGLTADEIDDVCRALEKCRK